MNNEYLGSLKSPVKRFAKTHYYPMRKVILKIVIKQKEPKNER